jgi:hypothetical protein
VRCQPALLGALWVLLGTAQGAHASSSAPHSLALSWEAAEGCPESAQVEQEISAALAHLGGHGAVQVVASVTARETGAGHWLRVKVVHGGEVGERVLPLDDCRDAARAAALLVALSVENVPEPPKPKKVTTARLRSHAWRLPVSVGLGPQLAFGLTPEVSAGVGLSLAYSHAFWRISLRGAAFAPSHHTIEGSQLGGSFRLASAGLFACAGHPSSPLMLYGCFGGRFDQLTGTGTGSSRDGSATTRLGSLAVGVTLEWSVTRPFRLRSELEVGYPLADARFVIRNRAQPVHEVAGPHARTGLELALAF